MFTFFALYGAAVFTGLTTGVAAKAVGDLTEVKSLKDVGWVAVEAATGMIGVVVAPVGIAAIAGLAAGDSVVKIVNRTGVSLSLPFESELIKKLLATSTSNN